MPQSNATAPFGVFKKVDEFISQNMSNMTSHALIEIQVRRVTPEPDVFFRVPGRYVFENDETDKFWDYVMHALEALGAGVAVGDENSWKLIGRGWGWEKWYPKEQSL